MAYVRILHPIFFDADRKRFNSQAFAPSSIDAGISVIDEECVARGGSSLCDHLREFYPELGGDPPSFWIFDAPDGVDVAEEPSKTGDGCHRNINGMTRNQSKRFVQGRFPEMPNAAVRICDGVESTPLSPDAAEERRQLAMGSP